MTAVGAQIFDRDVDHGAGLRSIADEYDAAQKTDSLAPRWQCSTAPR